MEKLPLPSDKFRLAEGTDRPPPGASLSMVVFEIVTENVIVANAYEKYLPDAETDVPLPPRAIGRGARFIDDSASDGGA